MINQSKVGLKGPSAYHHFIGLSGWFGILSRLFGHSLYADELATSIGRPLNSGFRMELGFASIGIGWVGFRSS